MNKVRFVRSFLPGLVAAMLLPAGPTIAAVRLPAVIGDHMVLQQRTDAPIWGWANLGEKIEVKASWASAASSAAADANGHWKLALKTPAAGGPYTIEVNGENRITLTDIMVGEVWICSGQSNMQMALNFPKPGYAAPVLNHLDEILQANHPGMRLFHVPYHASDVPVDDCKGTWRACSPETVGDFSAIGYFFGRYLQKRLNVPVGLINASQGGSALESWVSAAVLRGDKEYEHILKRYENALKNLPAAKANYQVELDAWKKLSPGEKAKALAPMPPFGVHKFCAPSTLYNGMISPILPFAIRGVIFYQGEENAIWPTNYEKLFAAMIRSWREVWKRPDLSFLYCQLASFGDGPLELAAQQYVDWHRTPDDPAQLTGETWARVQEAQLKSLRVPNTGMAVTADIGDPANGHFPNKQEAARRLALCALAGPYRQPVVCSGPIYRAMHRKGDAITISFEELQSPLRTGQGASVKGFTIAGADRVFHPADARVNGNEIEVTSRDVRDPIAVRYAWGASAQFNLSNREGLPASPFRTDTW